MATLHTFRVCCRLVRGFALDDDQALHLLQDWNARCQPPWTERELADKVCERPSLRARADRRHAGRSHESDAYACIMIDMLSAIVL